MGDFRDVKAWREAHQVALLIYHATRRFPASEKFGLVDQLRRASTSVGANLAEGCGRGTDPDRRRSCRIAYGSSYELLSFLLLARDLGFIDRAEFDAIEAHAEPMRKMIAGLIRSLSGPITRDTRR